MTTPSHPSHPASAPGAPSPDGHLIARAREGDHLAVTQLLTSHQHRLYAVCLRMLGTSPHDRQTAADLTQDALVKVIQGLPQFDAQSQFSTWAIRITMNVVLSHLRSQAVRKAAAASSRPATSRPENDDDSPHIAARSPQLNAIRHAAPNPPATSSPSSEQTGLSSVQHQELRDSLTDALAKLPVDHRAILILRDVRALEYDQIALVLGIEPGTVKSRLFRARLALRTALESTHPDASSSSV